MRLQNFLRARQMYKLQQALRESKSSYLRERILIFLLFENGMTYQEISRILGCSSWIVAYWCIREELDHLVGLWEKEKEEEKKILAIHRQLSQILGC